MQAARLSTRLQRELRMLQSDPPPGVCAWPCDDSLSHLQAQIQGPDGTVYAKGLFKLEIRVPDRYPFEPPNIRFKTPIYHPNIDSGGRICLDILNMPPKGAWKPSLNIPTVLASIGLLLSEPNPDDGLMGDITAEYKHNRLSFDVTARKWTHQYAVLEESVTRDNSAGNPGASDDVQKNTSTSVVNAEGSVTWTEFGNHGKHQHELSLSLQGVQTSASVSTTVSSKLAKCSVVSNSKLNLGTRLSLEKGTKESGNNTVDAGASDVSAVTSKGALACIENTVGTRQGALQESQVSRRTLVESITIEKTGKDTDGQLHHKENSGVADGRQALGVSTVYTHKTKSAGSSIDLDKFKRTPGGCAVPPPDSSPKVPTQGTCHLNKDKLKDIATTSSVAAAVESECLEKRSEYFTLPSKASRKSRIESLELSDKADNHEQGGPKSRICVAADTRPVRIPLTSYPLDRARVHEINKVPPSEQASGSSDPKPVVESSGRRPTSALLGSSTIGVTASRKEDNPERNSGGQLRNGAGNFKYGQPTNVRSNLDRNQTTDQDATAALPIRGSSPQSKEDNDLLVANPLLNETEAQSTCGASSLLQIRSEPQSKSSRATGVDVVILPDEAVLGKQSSKESGVVRPEMAKKPPIPAKPAMNVIVLDSESDDEPPRGRSRLSLSKRRGVRSKAKN